MTIAILIISAALLFYTWVGYPGVLALLSRFHRRPVQRAASALQVTIIVAAHDEERNLGPLLENLLSLDYPGNRIEIMVASDGSTDATEEIVTRFAAADPRIRLLCSPGRAGKSGVQNLAAAQSGGEILFFTDASARLRRDALRRMIENFSDPRVGLVTATVHLGEPQDAVAKGQGFYWRYELWLRQLESEMGILATGSGQGLAVRRHLFRALPARYGDDCIMPIDVRLQGYRVVQEPEAIVFDTMPHSIGGELGTRVRMTARNWAGTLARPGLLNPVRFPLTSLGLVSHKLLRWLTPFLLVTIMVANTLLALRHQALLFWLLQIGFYASAAVGWGRTRQTKPAGWFGYSFSFCLANVGFLLGMIQALRNQRIVAYEPAD